MNNEQPITLERIAWELTNISKELEHTSKSREDISNKVQYLEKQLDSVLITINIINDRLKDVGGFIAKAESSTLALAARVSMLEQETRDRLLREENTKLILAGESKALEAKRQRFMWNMKALAAVQSIIFVGMEIWHHLSK